MKTRASIHIVMALVALVAMRAPAGAQGRPSDPAALRADVERRFDVLPLRDGIALRPKRVSDVKSIEISSGVIALDGQPATGSELRSRLGADADLVIALSYMSDSERRSLFALGAAAQPSPAAPAPAAPAPPQTPSVVEPPDRQVTPETPRPPRRVRRRGNDDLVRIGQGVTVSEGEVIDGGVVAIGGPVRIDGEVHGDAVAVGGPMTLGAHAVIDGDVVVVGGQLTRADGARIGGGVREVGITGLNMRNWNWGNWSNAPFGPGAVVGSSFRLVGTLLRAAILCLLAAVVILLGRPYAERVGDRAMAEPFKAGAIGFLAQLLFLPVLVIVCVLLAITIIGIPLLLLVPFVILGLMIVGLVGFTGVAHQAGRWLAARLSWSDDNPYSTTFLGVGLLLAPVFLARVTGFGGGLLFPFAMALLIAGALVEYLAWTVGFGAVALTRFSPVPPAVVGSASGAGPASGPLGAAPVGLEGQGPTAVGP